MVEIGRLGKLEQRNLPRLLFGCYQEGKSAIIDLQRADEIKSLYMETGNIIFARSNQKSDRLGEYLVTNEIISREDLNKAANVLLKTGNRLGRILVEMGLISPKKLFVSVRQQIADIVLSIFKWSEGQFRVHEDLKPPEERIVLEKSTPELILEGSRCHVDADLDWKTAFDLEQFVILSKDHVFANLKYLEEEQLLFNTLKSPLKVSDLLQTTTLEREIAEPVFYRLFYFGYIMPLKEKESVGRTDRTEIWVWPRELNELCEKYGKAYRFIMRYAKIEGGQVILDELKNVLEQVRESCNPVFYKVMLNEEGTFEVEPIKFNSFKIQPNQRREKIHFALNEYLYGLLLKIQELMATHHHRVILQELKTILT
ncbi:DUF4388 domain-containing protein [candidate division CSSED10-310 bacterium]|uniref:DUF4388 domain-containing protein n=1 Tax=candidate division CSSED10-310 bacterium TaxID=2855610 RepID=A0ABV6Z5T5_UNCC1